MELWLALSVAAVVITFLAAYVAVMLIWPEWVGITGKVALEAERAHLGDVLNTENQAHGDHLPSKHLQDVIDNLQKRS